MVRRKQKTIEPKSEREIEAREDLISLFNSRGWLYIKRLLIETEKEAIDSVMTMLPTEANSPHIAKMQGTAKLAQMLLELDPDSVIERFTFAKEDSDEG